MISHRSLLKFDNWESYVYERWHAVCDIFELPCLLDQPSLDIEILCRDEMSNYNFSRLNPNQRFFESQLTNFHPWSKRFDEFELGISRIVNEYKKLQPVYCYIYSEYAIEDDNFLKKMKHVILKGKVFFFYEISSVSIEQLVLAYKKGRSRFLVSVLSNSPDVSELNSDFICAVVDVFDNDFLCEIRLLRA